MAQHRGIGIEEDYMGNHSEILRKAYLAVAMAFIVLTLAGCRPSEEKLSEAQATVAEIVAAREAAEEKYLDIADTSLRPELDQLGVKASETEAIDFTKMSNKKIDEKLPELHAIIDQYAIVQAKLDGTYKEEQDQNAENAKNEQIDAYIINKTGFNLTEIKLHDKTTDKYSENLLGEDTTIADGYTLMGVVLEIHSDSSEWEFVVKDDTGSEMILECESLLGKAEDGVSFTFTFDKETGIGTAVMN